MQDRPRRCIIHSVIILEREWEDEGRGNIWKYNGGLLSIDDKGP